MSKEELKSNLVWGEPYDLQYHYELFTKQGFDYINYYSSIRIWKVIEKNLKELEKQITQNILYVLKNTNFNEIEDKEKAIDRMVFYINLEGEFRDALKKTVIQVLKEIDRTTEEAREEFKQKTKPL